MSSGGMASSGAVLFWLGVPAWWRDLIWARGSGSIAVHRWMRQWPGLELGFGDGRRARKGGEERRKVQSARGLPKYV